MLPLEKWNFAIRETSSQAYFNLKCRIKGNRFKGVTLVWVTRCYTEGQHDLPQNKSSQHLSFQVGKQ